MTPAAASRPPKQPSWVDLTVLIVEDHADSADALRQALEAEGARAWVAVDGVDALDHLSRGLPDLILSDLRMPRLDGLQLAARIRQDVRWAHLPVVALTAYNAPADLHATLAAGFDGHLAKPIDFDTLTATMRRILEARRGRRRGGARGGRYRPRTRRR
ncbi:MAG: response regulator [Candidatus Rokuibacteriota bacterium]